MTTPANTKIVRPDKPVPNEPAFDAIAQKAQDTIGFNGLTIFTWDSDRSALRRLWSDNQEVFPTGGEKFMPLDAPWPQTLLVRQQPHCCWTAQDIKDTYNDSGPILGLATPEHPVESLLCVPAVYEGKVLGALNFTGRKYNEADLAKMKELANESVSVFVQLRAA